MKVVLLLIMIATLVYCPVFGFYNNSSENFGNSILNVTSYGANGNDAFSDSQAFIDAIDDATALPNGAIVSVPKGTYHLRGIALKSNVHLRVHHEATLILDTLGGTTGGGIFLTLHDKNHSICTSDSLLIHR